MKLPSFAALLIVSFLSLLSPHQALAWNDATHMAVVKAAGLDNYAYLAVGPDMAKEKARAIEEPNHYHDTPKGVLITPEMVLDEVRKYNTTGDAEGHLYGAIVASVNEYLLRGGDSKYARYPLGYAAHYIGDLSMPFHNMAYDSFNRENHAANDGILEMTGPPGETTDAKVARIAREIRKRMAGLPPLQLSADIRSFYRELAIQIAAIANKASAIGYSMEDADPPRTRLTEEEAYAQLAQSAQLLQAVQKAITK